MNAQNRGYHVRDFFWLQKALPHETLEVSYCQIVDVYVRKFSKKKASAKSLKPERMTEFFSFPCCYGKMGKNEG